MSDLTERAEYIAGLRMLANALEQNPDLRLPYSGSRSHLLVIPSWEENQRAELAAWSRVLPGRKEKQTNGTAFYFKGKFAGLGINVICDRDEVCERVVVGTETVTETVKDPEAVAALPDIQVTEEREIVEWRCGSVLADEAVSS